MRTALVFLLPACFAADGQQIYDLLLKNGHVIDPANRRSTQLDVAVTGNKIGRVARDLPAAHARVVVDLDGCYVTPGLIDINVHIDTGSGRGKLRPDYNTLPSGVTTAVDAGSSGWKTFPDFKTGVIDHSKTRLLAFLNAGAIDADAESIARVVGQYPQIIVGIAAYPETLAVALDAAQRSGTIVILDANSQRALEYAGLLKQLRRGDINTHVYSRLTPQMDGNGRIRPELPQTRRRGVLFDAGHGSGGLWFRIAQPAVQQGFLPDTISSGMDTDSIVLPRANMITTMSKFLNMGMSVDQIIERTTVNPALAIRRPELGTLSEGAVADIAVLQIEKGRFGFLDSGHARLDGERRLRCVLTIRNGAIVWDSDGLSLPDWIKAGPYTNFK
jgi:dihydroorotase